MHGLPHLTGQAPSHQRAYGREWQVIETRFSLTGLTFQNGLNRELIERGTDVMSLPLLK
jgi:hypothetical protein